jgi:ATP-binding cassette subfamily B protein
MEKNARLQDSLPSLWRLALWLWPYLREHRALLAGSVFALIAEISLRVLEPWPVKWVVDRISNGNTPAAGRGFLDQLDPMTLFIVAAVSSVLFTGLRALADYLNTLGFSIIGGKVLTDIRHEVYRHVQRLSLSFHTKARSGDLILRLTGDVNMLRDIAVTAGLPLAVNFVVLVSMIGIMFWLHWRLALLAFTCLPLFWLLTFHFGKRIRESSRKHRGRLGGMAATAAESIGAIKTVQALSLEDTFTEAFSRQNQKSLNDDLKAARLSGQLGRTVEILTAVAAALVLLYGARLAVRNEITIGDLILFLAYLKTAFKPMREHARHTARISKAAAAGERIMELMGETPEVRDLPGAVRAPSLEGAVRFDRVSFGYEPDQMVLKSVSLDVPSGTHVALVGPSGIGKSTLVSLILRLHDPVEGRVMIDGRDIRDYTIESLRGQVSVVLQDTVLFAASAWDNIAYGAAQSSRAEIEGAARLAQAHDFILALPQGYDTILGERGLTLSNGQRQRIAIARAAVRQAPILILDEPTIGLDEENERAVIQAIERVSAERTTFLITHDLSLASRSDLICYLEGGRVAEQGSHRDLMQVNGRYAALYMLQASSLNEPLRMGRTR